MDVDNQFDLEHLYLTERICRSCGQQKDLIDGFYRTRKNRYHLSSYSYECKECTIKRVMNSKKKTKKLSFDNWEYPDW